MRCMEIFQFGFGYCLASSYLSWRLMHIGASRGRAAVEVGSVHTRCATRPRGAHEKRLPGHALLKSCQPHGGDCGRQQHGSADVDSQAGRERTLRDDLDQMGGGDPLLHEPSIACSLIDFHGLGRHPLRARGRQRGRVDRFTKSVGRSNSSCCDEGVGCPFRVTKPKPRILGRITIPHDRSWRFLRGVHSGTATLRS